MAAKPKSEQATVTMAVQMSGTRDGEDWPARGEQLTCSPGEAEGLIAAGIATAASDAVETATAGPTETR